MKLEKRKIRGRWVVVAHLPCGRILFPLMKEGERAYVVLSPSGGVQFLPKQ